MHSKAIGIDLGGTNIRVAVVNSSGEIERFHSERVPRGREAQMSVIRACVERMVHG